MSDKKSFSFNFNAKPIFNFPALYVWNELQFQVMFGSEKVVLSEKVFIIQLFFKLWIMRSMLLRCVSNVMKLLDTFSNIVFENNIIANQMKTIQWNVWIKICFIQRIVFYRERGCAL